MIKKQLNRALAFLRNELWTIDENKLKSPQRYALRLLRIVILAVENFKEKKLILQASALTFYTLLSIVPVAAMVFGIAKGFGLEKRLALELNKLFERQPELLESVLEFVNRLLANTQGGLIAGFGFVVLLWSVIQVLSNVEESFNNIWELKTARTWVRKFTDYLTIMLFAPIFIITSGSATIYISTHVTQIAEGIAAIGFIKNLMLFSLNLIPYLLSAILFTFVYVIMPNTKVKFSTAAVAGLVAGISFQLFQWIYIEFQVGVNRLNAIYGSFAFFPLFISFLQLSWVIVLIGAEVSFSLQNMTVQLYDKQIFRPSHKLRLTLAFTIMHQVVHKFKLGEEPLNAKQIATKTGLPYKIVTETCFILENASLLCQTFSEKSDVYAFLPAFDVERITIAEIIHRLDFEGDIESEQYTAGLPAWSLSLTENIYRSMSSHDWNLPIASYQNPK